MPYTSVNGHMFSYITREHTLALRLPPAELEGFLKKYKTQLQEAYGIVQKEYVAIPGALFKKQQNSENTSSKALTMSLR